MYVQNLSPKKDEHRVRYQGNVLEDATGSRYYFRYSTYIASLYKSILSYQIDHLMGFAYAISSNVLVHDWFKFTERSRARNRRLNSNSVAAGMATVCMQ